MQKIETFMTPASDKYAIKRAKYTKMFIEKHFWKNAKTVLDIGEHNIVGRELADYFELKIKNTSGDLDYDFTAPSAEYDVVFCLEVIEHLMSPKYFLLELKKYINKKTQIFITYPGRPKILWTNQHFHEYDKVRFKYLIDKCGYVIVAWEKERIPRSIFTYFLGFRPLLRIFFNFDNLVYIRLK